MKFLSVFHLNPCDYNIQNWCFWKHHFFWYETTSDISIFVLFVSDEYDAYIIVSFVNATLVLSIGETVEEVTDSGFLGTTPTLSCSALSDDALVQVDGWIISLLEQSHAFIFRYIPMA